MRSGKLLKLVKKYVIKPLSFGYHNYHFYTSFSNFRDFCLLREKLLQTNNKLIGIKLTLKFIFLQC